MTNDYEAYRKANDYLNKKHINVAYQHGNSLAEMEEENPNVMYAFKRDSYKFVQTPVTTDMIEQAKKEVLYITEESFKGFGPDFQRAIIDLASKVKETLGSVSLKDTLDIEEASKDEIRKLKTRVKQSMTEEEMKARAAELEALINLYEERENDTERDDLIDKYQSIREGLEQAQDGLEHNNKDDCVSSLDEALYR